MERPTADPLVTIMIPTYGQAGVLARAVSSALEQDVRSLEVIVADDASPDETSAVVAGFADPRLRYHRNPENLGRVANYRRTLETLARGKYVLNLDGDDWLVDSTYVRRAVELMEGDDEIALVFANAWRYSEATDEYFTLEGQNTGLATKNSGNDLFVRYASRDVWIPHLTAVYRRDLAVSIGFYRLDVIGSDTDSLLRMILGRQVGFLEGVVAAWRIHDRNATGNLDVAAAVANLACVDGPYRTAVEIGAADGGALLRWRAAMRKRLCLDFLRRAGRKRMFGDVARFLAAVAVRSPVTAVSATLGVLEYLAADPRLKRVQLRRAGEEAAA